MYRLLIVDDEPVILEGLVQLFEQLDEPKLDVCQAYSPGEAIELAKRTKIDIVLSDIRMPGKTGLQMIDDIVFYWPDCRIIFLTGYSEFDYIYTAFQKNVESFILKTEEDSVVSMAVYNEGASAEYGPIVNGEHVISYLDTVVDGSSIVYGSPLDGTYKMSKLSANQLPAPGSVLSSQLPPN
jgi:Response regulator containing CheY-like receiver domain and AraC-type DNA-binding domain